jgi:Ca2+-binding RTX toxin-like protein
VGLFAIASRGVACAFVLVAISSAGSARAATVAVSGDSVVRYAADPGERNVLTVTASVNAVTFDDTGASVTAGRGCDQLGPHTARCYPPGNRPTTVVDSSDGDDTVRAVDEPGASTGLTVLGGEGDDSLTAADRGSLLYGGPGADTLDGGAGPDTLEGGPGPDTLNGGGGDDSITGDGEGAAPAPDVVDGGPGSDGISYGERTTAVDVDLERPSGNGGAGENDTIRQVENVFSGGGSDHIRGDEHANHLVSTDLGLNQPNEHDVVEGRGGDDRIEGSENADVLSGGRGGDVIEGWGGRDTLRGGPGDDGIDLDDTRPRSFRCGSGDDLVNYPRSRELVPADCETVQVDGLFFLVATRLGRARAGVRTLAISGLDIVLPEERPCRLVAKLFRGAATLGQGDGRLPPRGQDRTKVAVRLTAAGRRVFASHRRLPVRLVLEGHYSCRAGDRRIDAGAGGFAFPSR